MQAGQHIRKSTNLQGNDLDLRASLAPAAGAVTHLSPHLLRPVRRSVEDAGHAEGVLVYALDCLPICVHQAVATIGQGQLPLWPHLDM